jgi:hypothetical protein
MKADDWFLFGRRPVFVTRFKSLSFAMTGNRFRGGGSITAAAIQFQQLFFAVSWRRQQTWVKYYDTFCILSNIKELRGK